MSYLLILEGGLDLSRVDTGGYVACQSASLIGARPGDGGCRVVEKDRGEGGLLFPLDIGREVGGDSRSRGGSFGDGVRCKGDEGREGARELQ